MNNYPPEIQRLITIMKATTIARTDFHWQYPKKIPVLMYDDKNKKKPTRITDEMILQHIKGTIVLGLSPFVNSEKVLYGKLDLDAHAANPEEQEQEQKIVNEDIDRISKELDKEGYLYYIHSSGSSGRHLVLYNNEPISAKKMQYFLKDLQFRILRKKDKKGNDTEEPEIRHEVFPKQTDLYDVKYGNQAKAVLAKHPKTGLLAGVLKDGKVLNKTDSINFLEELMNKIPNAKPIEFEITPEMEEKYKKNNIEMSTEEIQESNDKNIPKYCSFFEKIACKYELPSGGANRHEFLDGNFYQYSKDKPEVYKNYCQTQGRNHTAFNGGDQWVFSCRTIHKYINKNDGDIIKKAKLECKKCSHNPDNRLIELENTNIKELKQQVIQELSREKGKGKLNATELMSKFFQDTIATHTTRDDQKSEIWVYKEGIYVPHGKTYIKQFCRRVLTKAYSLRMANLVIEKIEVDTYIEHDNFFIEEDVNLLPVQNGILNIKTKELMDFSSDYRFFVKLPTKYNPEAKCPNIIKHFKSVLKHENDILTMQEVFGFCLYRDYKYEKGMMWLGTGRNGKGKSLELLKNLLGHDNCTNISLQQLDKDGFAMSELFHKMANLCSDMSNTALEGTGNFKALTGHDMITASRKFLSMIRFTNYAKMIFLANETPEPSDTSVAFWDRWVLLDFPYTFKLKKEFEAFSETEKVEQNLKLADEEHLKKLLTEEELEGCLIWALKGMDRLFLQRGFSATSSSKEIEEHWIRRSNSFEAFFLDCVESDWDSFVIKDDLRKAYFQYCTNNKLKCLGNKDIKNSMEEKNVISSKQRIKMTDNVDKSLNIRINTGESIHRNIWKGIKLR